MSAITSPAPVDLTTWDPENEATWDSRLAWRTLWITTYSLLLGFATWYLVSAIAPRLTAIGFDLSTVQLYWLAAIPGLAGGLLRFGYMFLPPIVGTRRLIGWSSLLLALPMIGWTLAVRDTSTPYWVLLALAFSAGIGGGVFAGYMPSTSYFFPKRLQGTALGLQAGIGNFGIGLVQVLVPWVIGFGLFGTWFLDPQTTTAGANMWLHNGGLVLIPWAVLASILGFVFLKRVPVKANIREQMDIFRLKHTWIMTAIYMMTFGAYAGLAAQMGLIIVNVYGGFENAPDPLTYAWIGPAVGAAVRAASGPLCDRFGGAPFTLISGIGMTAGTILTLFFLTPTDVNEFWGFLAGMITIFVFAGFGNAGTFKQMPMIFPKRQAGGVVGFTSAVAAFGPFIVGMALSAVSPTVFFVVCAVWCVLCTGLTWWFYARPGAEAKS
ncbi:MFS transporter [Microbacterium sp. B2969]|uniref:MFS transporter n=1 Tax=Microbacterium alkaliflavum TaxID=3248839 RepID=A0ABW7Q2W3_9MICO